MSFNHWLENAIRTGQGNLHLDLRSGVKEVIPIQHYVLEIRDGTLEGYWRELPQAKHLHVRIPLQNVTKYGLEQYE
jgi:hypothetical protein